MNTQFTIDENSPQIEQPRKISIPLKPHQLAMICAMRQLEEEDKIPIINPDHNSYQMIDSYFKTSFGSLCDKVGSGKSLSILGVIASQKVLPTKPKCARTYSNKIQMYSTFQYNIPLNLLVVPHGIMGQWCNYITTQTTLDAMTIKNKKTYEVFQKKITEYREEHNPDIFTEDLVIASNTFYKRLSDDLQDLNINRLLIDEIETIKIPSSQEISAEFTWFISSSINILQNPNGTVCYEPYGYVNWNGAYVTSTRRVIKDKMPHTGYFKDTLGYVSQVPFREQVYLKCTDNFVFKSFLLPEIEVRKIQCKDTIYSHVLQGLVTPEVMSMINAGDIEGAIESSGIEQQNSENLVTLLTTEFQNKLQNLKIELDAKKLMIFSSADAKKKSLEKIEVKIEDLETKIDCIKKRVLETEGCPICFDEIKNRVILTCCGNPFCYECITLSLNAKNSCPLCRSEVCKHDMVFLQDAGGCKKASAEEDENEDTTRSKLENLDKYLSEILEANETPSILIFSEYEKSLYDIENMLRAKGLSFSQLQGQASFIDKTVRRFKDKEIPILLLNSRYFGSGLNLENTTHMFMFHKMKSHIDKQVIGRAQRPGRIEPLQLYRMCYSNEM